MSKKRKTRKEKMRTILRNQSLSQNSSIPVYSIESLKTIKPEKVETARLTTLDYSYVVRDMRQTIIITFILLLASLILHTLITTNILHLTYFGY